MALYTLVGLEDEQEFVKNEVSTKYNLSKDTPWRELLDKTHVMEHSPLPLIHFVRIRWSDLNQWDDYMRWLDEILMGCKLWSDNYILANSRISYRARPNIYISFSWTHFWSNSSWAACEWAWLHMNKSAKRTVSKIHDEIRIFESSKRNTLAREKLPLSVS